MASATTLATRRRLRAGWLADELPFIGKANPARADAVTINGYLGSDGIHPFEAKEGAGLFVLGKRQTHRQENSKTIISKTRLTVYETMASLCHDWGESNLVQAGFHVLDSWWGDLPEVAARIRQIAPNSLFLMPGVGAQGAEWKVLLGSRATATVPTLPRLGESCTASTKLRVPPSNWRMRSRVRPRAKPVICGTPCAPPW